MVRSTIQPYDSDWNQTYETKFPV